MSTEVKVPTLPESVSDATVAKWHKKAGDSVKRDENLVDLETDKVVLEVPAPADGVLESIEAEEGETVNADDVLGKIAEGESGEDSESEDEDEKEKEKEDKEKGDQEGEDEKDEKEEKEEKDDDEAEKKKEKESSEKAEKKESGDGKTSHEAPEGADKLAPAV